MPGLGERIRYARRLKHMTQLELARALQVSAESVVSNWESNKRHPGLDVVRRIAALTGVSLGYLLGEVDEPHAALFNGRRGHEREVVHLLQRLLDEVRGLRADIQASPEDPAPP